MPIRNWLNRFNNRHRISAIDLKTPPRPLLDLPHRTVVSWSAKSACTHVLIWHLQRVGLLTQAQEHHHWPHRFREALYEDCHVIRQARGELLNKGGRNWTYVKIVRDPANRCVSSFRHALKHGYEDEKISRVLEKTVSAKQGFSFQTFLEYLSKIDIQKCNIHHKIQTHPLDFIAFHTTYLVNIDKVDLGTSLNAIDRAQGYCPDQSDSRAHAAIKSASSRHAPEQSGNSPESSSVWQTPLKTSDSLESWPKSSELLTDAARQQIAQIYHVDYETMKRLQYLSQ